jgi:DNA-directed RNA polymerase specialized sigma24 family protein
MHAWLETVATHKTIGMYDKQKENVKYTDW